MAEQIQQPELGKEKGMPRSKRLSTKVDLTPMVDLGFLLITFFILTKTLSEAKHLRLHLPAGEQPTMPIAKSAVLTIVPLADEKIFYYEGDVNDAIKDNSSYGVINNTGIRTLIIKKQLALDANPKFSRKDLELIIKPTQLALYKSIIGVLDEVLINDLQHYSFVDLSPDENDWLKEMKLQ